MRSLPSDRVRRKQMLQGVLQRDCSAGPPRLRWLYAWCGSQCSASRTNAPLIEDPAGRRQPCVQGYAKREGNAHDGKKFVKLGGCVPDVLAGRGRTRLAGALQACRAQGCGFDSRPSTPAMLARLTLLTRAALREGRCKPWTQCAEGLGARFPAGKRGETLSASLPCDVARSHGCFVMSNPRSTNQPTRFPEAKRQNVTAKMAPSTGVALTSGEKHCRRKWNAD